MMLQATYRNEAGYRSIGSYVTYEEPSSNFFLRMLGRTNCRARIDFEEVEVSSAMQALERLHQEGGFLQIKLCDGLSSVDINDYGDGVKFFIEQYYDVIYGGFYDLSAAREVLNALFNGMTRNGLRDFFPTLPGELLYEYEEGANLKNCDANAISPLCRNALRFDQYNEG